MKKILYFCMGCRVIHYDNVKQSINECLKKICFELREHPSYTYDKIKNIFKEEFGELVQ